MAERTFFYPVGLKKETTKGTAVTPDVYVPCYSESLTTDIHLISDEPAFGRRLKRMQSLQGNRSHAGSMKLMAEPNSISRVIDMCAARTATSGANPYTHTFTESITTDPHSYTVDIVKGVYVERFYGVEASKIKFGFNNDKMEIDVDVTGLGSFYPREVASISGSGPYTIVLKTDYDPSPTTGLVVGDAIKAYDVSLSSYTTATVATIVDGVSITTVTDVSAITAGDMLMLAPPTPSLSLLTPFLLGRTQFFFAATAATALSNSATVANQTRLEPSTEVTLMNDFSNADGEPRSGSFDPASLIRAGGYDLEFKPQVFLDTPDKIAKWAAIAKNALVMRSYSGSTSQYELRVTLNDIRSRTNDTPGDASKTLYHTFDYAPNYDSSDSQMFDIKVINALSAV